ncbi:NUDIX domain-containing protein [Fulvimarina endophytica]|uniref:NUDIX domain-containing protein n=1 Tax=Fulvimarina endophytica TaxID=2293836 RepID=A0A371X3A8_9HYPH|nr:NUDIX domain-containing protein [Fulvimarina endophytica]RFC63717.1 NUDIX domain-containing protein [Fulvimarina endophytica]
MAFEKLKRRVFHAGFLLTRPMTLGVRVAAFDEAGRVFLVRHTYVSGWHMPGGGVDAGESAGEAALREMAEEGNLEAPNGLALRSVHFNPAYSRRDHVLFYEARGVTQTGPRAPDREIAETGFFAAGALPEGTSRATRRRLDELVGVAVPDPRW